VGPKLRKRNLTKNEKGRSGTGRLLWKRGKPEDKDNGLGKRNPGLTRKAQFIESWSDRRRTNPVEGILRMGSS